MRKREAKRAALFQQAKGQKQKPLFERKRGRGEFPDGSPPNARGRRKIRPTKENITGNRPTRAGKVGRKNASSLLGEQKLNLGKAGAEVRNMVKKKGGSHYGGKEMGYGARQERACQKKRTSKARIPITIYPVARSREKNNIREEGDQYICSKGDCQVRREGGQKYQKGGKETYTKNMEKNLTYCMDKVF